MPDIGSVGTCAARVSGKGNSFCHISLLKRPIHSQNSKRKPPPEGSGFLQASGNQLFQIVLHSVLTNLLHQEIRDLAVEDIPIEIARILVFSDIESLL